jgi:hypothetical protein
MNTSDRPSRLAGIAINVVLAIVFAAGLAFTGYMINDSWGGNYWVFDLAVGVVVSLLALARGFNLALTAAAGVIIAAVAIVVAVVAELPHEPGPITSLALSVLVGSAIRRLPTPWAYGIAAGGLTVVIGAWISGGSSAVALLCTVTWLGAVAIGASLRTPDAGRRAEAEKRRAPGPELTYQR